MWRNQVSTEEVDAMIATMKAVAANLRDEEERRAVVNTQLADLASRMERAVARVEGNDGE